MDSRLSSTTESATAPAAGLVLGGGMGRRFGVPKAFATLPDGRTFLEACASTMHQCGLNPVVATVPPDIEGRVPGSVHAIRLPQHGLDMFASIRLGLQCLVEQSGWGKVIILPVDHPLVQPETIATLIAQDHPASIPTLDSRHGHPIMISRGVAEGIAQGSLPGPTLREVLRAAPAHDVAVGDRGIRANCNTPDTLREAWVLTRPDASR